MTINHVLDKIRKISEILGSIDFDSEDGHSKKYNQGQVHKAYKELDFFRDECLRELVLMKQRRNK